MQNIRKQFPVFNQYIYANTAAFGLLSEPLLEWRQEHDLDYLIGGSKLKIESLGLISQTKQTVGDFFGSKKENVALVPNFSFGLNTLLEGLDKKNKVLLLAGDYPSVNWPFESRSFTISYVKIDEHLEDHIFQKIKTDNISVLALSLVQWLDGIKIDLDFLKLLKETCPELIIVADGTQFCGAFDINFEASGIDILGASAYKWLLAGTGNGFMLLKEGIKHRFSLKTIGFNSANANLDEKENIQFSKLFEPGHLDSTSFGSLKFSLEVLSKIGMATIETYNKTLSIKAKKIFENMGLLTNAVVQRREHSTIFNIKGHDALFRYLSDNNVVCSQRGGGIRLSFHLYNTENDVDSIAEILKTAR